MNNIMQQFEQFKRTVNGNPEQIVKEMLSSGKITQQDLEQAKQMAEMFKHLIK